MNIVLRILQILLAIAFVMVSTIWHVVRSEISSALITLVLLGMANYVVWMRHRGLPIRERIGGGLG